MRIATPLLTWRSTSDCGPSATSSVISMPRLIGPGCSTTAPAAARRRRCAVSHDFDAALEGVDAVMMLRLQRERMAEGLVDSLEDYHRDYGLTAARLRRAAADAVVLHPGPMNRGVEIDDDVADGAQSLILRQVANGVAVRMGVLEALLGRRG